MRSNTSAAVVRPQMSRFGSHFGMQTGNGWNEIVDNSSNSLPEDDEDDEDEGNEEQQWGLSKGMELFEVSAKDDLGAFTFRS
jgi:hypothetical protein